jgi:hypothetical protein
MKEDRRRNREIEEMREGTLLTRSGNRKEGGEE